MSVEYIIKHVNRRDNTERELSCQDIDTARELRDIVRRGVSVKPGSVRIVKRETTIIETEVS